MAEAQDQEDPSLTLARLSIRGSTTTTTTDTHTDTHTDTTNKPLRTLFHDAHHLYTQLDNGDATDTHTHTQALTLLHELQRRVASLGLLSTNEEDEKDIPTADLKYILLDFYLGTLATHTPTNTDTHTHTHTPLPPPQARLAAVEKARRYFLSFMSKCERLGLLKGEEEKKAWAAEKETEEDTEDQEEEEDDSGNDHRRRALLPTRSRINSGASNVSAEAQRSYKIARFRKEKEVKSRLRELDYMYEKLSEEGGGGGGKGKEEEEDDEEEDMYGQLEEVERERTKLWVSAAVSKVLDEWPMLRQEKQILVMMCKNPPTDTRTQTHGMEGREDGRRRPAVAAKPLQVTHIDTVAGPGSQLRIRQEELRAGVFQPGYNLPTMSLDEYAQQQMAEAQARTDAQTHAQAQAEGGGGPPRRYKQLEEEGKEDEEGLVEEAVYADRAWDAFKDEHPFGSGNKAGKLF